MADADNNPHWVAMDLLSQAEHDESAQSILITDDRDFADDVAAAVEEILPTLARADVAGASWRDHGAIITVADWDEGVALANQIAAEHLEIATADPQALAEKNSPCRGHFPWAVDAGSDWRLRRWPEPCSADGAHVTVFIRGLGVLDFMKRTTMVECDAGSLHRIGPGGGATGGCRRA